MLHKETRLRETQKAIAALVTGKRTDWKRRLSAANLTTPQNLGVYRYAYFYRLITTLAFDYPSIFAVVGGKAFRKLARDYFHDFPPSEWSLHGIGKFFGRYLKTYPLTKTKPFLPELARLETAILEAGRAADTKRYLRRLSFGWPVDTIRKYALFGKPIVPAPPKRTRIEIRKNDLRVSLRRV